MKKKILATVLTAAMAVSMLAGCSSESASKASEAAATTAEATTAAEETKAEETTAAEAKVCRAICCDTADNFCLHIKHSAFGPLLLLQLLKFSPQTICCVRRYFQEGLIPIVRGVVVLDKVANIHALFPQSSRKTTPLFKICHNSLTSFLFCICLLSTGLL